MQRINLDDRLVFRQRPLEVVADFDNGGEGDVLIGNSEESEVSSGDLHGFAFVHEVDGAVWDLEEDF